MFLTFIMAVKVKFSHFYTECFVEDYPLFFCPFEFFQSEASFVMVAGGKIWHCFNETSSDRSAQFFVRVCADTFACGLICDFGPTQQMELRKDTILPHPTREQNSLSNYDWLNKVQYNSN